MVSFYGKDPLSFFFPLNIAKKIKLESGFCFQFGFGLLVY